MKVLVTSKSFASCSDEALHILKDKGFEIIPNPKGRLLTEEEMMEYIQGVDAVILGTDVFSQKVIDCADKLKIVSRYGVGLDKVDCEYLKEKGIELKIAANANTNSVADHAVGLMLSVCHNITRCDRYIHNGEWKKPMGKDLYQSTVGILGLGAIGKSVARRVHGFDCKILAFDKFYDDAFVEEYGIQKASIDEIFEQADFITLHMPALPEFTPLITKETFAKMKDDAVLINTARAKLIDQEALYEAIEKNQIYGFGSDVHYQEPNIDEKLMQSENVVVTPHIAASSIGSINNMSRIAAQNIVDYFEGKE
ncbi:phosphoglycerate dehydrogenase [Amedibacillus sp. YH-ame10]